MTGPAVVALGGGHGLAASLAALRSVTDDITAVVTVADDGGSSGRLRREFGTLPPGDLRMALAALCDDDERGAMSSRILQHRFGGQGDLRGHALGNLVILAATEQLGDPIAALDLVGRMAGVRGRVLPMSVQPLDIVADVAGLDPANPAAVREICGQVEVASARGRVLRVSLRPDAPVACPDAVRAVRAADWVVLGPGSWFTSVLPHLLVPALADAIVTTAARRAVLLNLAPQPGETDDFSPEAHLDVLSAYAPGLIADVVVADARVVAHPAALRDTVANLGGRLVLADVGMADGSPRHDPERVARVLSEIFSDGPMGSVPAGEERSWR